MAGIQPVDSDTPLPSIDPGSGCCELSPVLRPANKNRASVRCIQWGSRMSVPWVAKVRFWAGAKCNGSSFPHQSGTDTSLAAASSLPGHITHVANVNLEQGHGDVT